jgi:hypothetical protein
MMPGALLLGIEKMRIDPQMTPIVADVGKKAGSATDETRIEYGSENQVISLGFHS